MQPFFLRNRVTPFSYTHRPIVLTVLHTVVRVTKNDIALIQSDAKYGALEQNNNDLFKYMVYQYKNKRFK